MFYKKLSIGFILLCSLFLIMPTQAVCPLCTIAVGAGIGLSRWLGIDDSVTGLWLGGFIVSLIIWTIGWLKKKNYVFFGFKSLIFIFYYLLIILPLYFKGIFGHPLNTLWGVDKLALGIVLGSLFFFLGCQSYTSLKKKNNNRAHFPFEKIVFPIAPLVILSLIFYFLTK